jgi:hypothetical protein
MYGTAALKTQFHKRSVRKGSNSGEKPKENAANP